ncbi:MAG: response regulator [Acidobacteriota bacterium]
MPLDPGICHRALVVEDDPAIRRLVEKLLQRRGIVIDTAYDGKQAIEKIGAHDYSVVILDLMLPEVNGYEVIAYIKSRGLRLPVVVVSAVSQQALSRLDLDIVKLVISKPFDVHEFTEGIAAVCGEAVPPV